MIIEPAYPPTFSTAPTPTPTSVPLEVIGAVFEPAPPPSPPIQLPLDPDAGAALVASMTGLPPPPPPAPLPPMELAAAEAFVATMTGMPAPAPVPPEVSQAIAATDPSNQAEHLQTARTIIGGDLPETHAAILDVALTEPEKEARIREQTQLQDRQRRAEYWAKHKQYVDAQTGVVFAASFDVASGALTLDRRQQLDGAYTHTQSQVLEDTSTTTESSSFRVLEAGGFEETRWSSATDAAGEVTALDQAVTTTQNLPESGLNQTTAETKFDPQVTAEDGLPQVREQTVTVENQRELMSSKLELEQGQLVRQTVRSVVTTEGYDQQAIDRAKEGLRLDLDAAAKDDYDPDHAALGSINGLKDGASRLEIVEIDDKRAGKKTRTEQSTRVTAAEHAFTISEQNANIAPDRAAYDEVIHAYDAKGSDLREDHARKEIIARSSAVAIDPEGTPTITHAPEHHRTLQEGADDDWIYDEVSFERKLDGAVPEDAKPKKIHHEQDFDYWEAGFAGWMRNQGIGLTGAVLTTAGLGAQVFIGPGTLVGGALIAGGVGLAAIDTAIQVHAAIQHHPGASWTSAGLSGLGLIPGGRFKAVAAASGFTKTAAASVRLGAFAADAGYTAYAGADLAARMVKGDATLEDAFFAATVAAGFLANNRLARRMTSQPKPTAAPESRVPEQVRTDLDRLADPNHRGNQIGVEFKEAQRALQQASPEDVPAIKQQMQDLSKEHSEYFIGRAPSEDRPRLRAVGDGVVDEREAMLPANERELAEKLAAEGNYVQKVKVGDGRSPDVLVNGEPTELKTVTSADYRRLRDRILESAAGTGQAPAMVTSAQNMSREAAERAISEAMLDPAVRANVRTIRVVGSDFDFTVQVPSDGPRHASASDSSDPLDPVTRRVRELDQLTDDDLRAVYPGVAFIPQRASNLAPIEGFADFVKHEPYAARVVIDASATFGGARQRIEGHVRAAIARGESARVGFEQAAIEYRRVQPSFRPHPTNPNYHLIERAAESPDWLPAMMLSPGSRLDHNGFFNDMSVPKLRFPAASQVFSDGKPLENLDGVLVFGAHGSSNGFTGLTTSQAATMVADQIRDARRRGIQIDKVLLVACDQRNWAHGGSNAKSLQRLIDAELGQTGQRGATVYAPSRAGTLWSDFSQEAYFRGGHVPAAFTKASSLDRPYVEPRKAQDAAVLGAGVAGLIAGLTYRAVRED